MYIATIVVIIAVIVYLAIRRLVTTNIYARSPQPNTFKSMPARAASLKKGHAIVIGSGIAGMFSARVLSEYFERVTIVESDSLPSSAIPRAGAPQSNQAHVLTPKGGAILEYMFSNMFKQELKDYDQPVFDWMKNGVNFARGKPSPTGEHMLVTAPARNFIEQGMRLRIKSISNITLVENTRVNGFVKDEKSGRIRGVRIKQRDSSDHPDLGEEILADLVCCTAGRQSAISQWLEKVGYKAPEFKEANAFVRYVTHTLRYPKDSTLKAVLVLPEAGKSKRGGVIVPITNDTYDCILYGYGKETPPHGDFQEFLEWSSTLLGPHVYNMLKASEPLGSPRFYPVPSSKYYSFHTMPEYPDGLIVLGDAVCSVNPVYAQGMTSAALSAVILEEWLAKNHTQNQEKPGACKQFQSNLTEVLDDIWNSANMADFSFPDTIDNSGKIPIRETFGFKAAFGFLNSLIDVTRTDVDILKMYTSVMLLMAHPIHMFHPKVLFAVLKAKIFGC